MVHLRILPADGMNAKHNSPYLCHNTRRFAGRAWIMGWFIQNAYAQAEGQPNSFLSLLPLVLIFAVFYFLLIRPQNKRQKEHKEMVANLAVGDEVATAGGVLGQVTEVRDQFVHVQVADGVVLKVQRNTISSVMPKGTVKNA
jgi:preprotein translocase subunit YajC